MAASVPAFPTSLANAGKMPALLEAGAPRMPASRSPKDVYKDQGIAQGWYIGGPLALKSAIGFAEPSRVVTAA